MTTCLISRPGFLRWDFGGHGTQLEKEEVRLESERWDRGFGIGRVFLNGESLQTMLSCVALEGSPTVEPQRELKSFIAGLVFHVLGARKQIPSGAGVHGDIA